MATKVAKITWTDKQKEIAKLVDEGKTFTDIINAGYSKHMTSRVLAALKAGQKPEPEPGHDETGTSKGLLGITGPKNAPITFKVASKEITLDPLELYNQYRFYESLARQDGLSYSFSEVLTMGIQLIWMMKQDIPLTENMMRAIFYG
jgi:hypothetical protein